MRYYNIEVNYRCSETGVVTIAQNSWGGNNVNGLTKDITYHKRALSDSDLRALAIIAL